MTICDLATSSCFAAKCTITETYDTVQIVYNSDPRIKKRATIFSIMFLGVGALAVVGGSLLSKDSLSKFFNGKNVAAGNNANNMTQSNNNSSFPIVPPFGGEPGDEGGSSSGSAADLQIYEENPKTEELNKLQEGKDNSTPDKDLSLTLTKIESPSNGKLSMVDENLSGGDAPDLQNDEVTEELKDLSKDILLGNALGVNNSNITDNNGTEFNNSFKRGSDGVGLNDESAISLQSNEETDKTKKLNILVDKVPFDDSQELLGGSSDQENAMGQANESMINRTETPVINAANDINDTNSDSQESKEDEVPPKI